MPDKHAATHDLAHVGRTIADMMERGFGLPSALASRASNGTPACVARIAFVRGIIVTFYSTGRATVRAPDPDDFTIVEGCVLEGGWRVRPPQSGVELIAVERVHQLGKWSPEHDADHDHGELAIRAAELAVDGTDESISDVRGDGRDPWGLVEKHRGDRVRQLAIAGALLAAELDRVLAGAA